jgi:hypothetical protein
LAICFEVSVNGEAPVVAGAEHVGVLSAIVSYVLRHGELGIAVGGLLSQPGMEDEHWSWLRRDLRVGDELLIKVVQDQQPTEPVKRVRQSAVFPENEERAYYERLKRKYEPDSQG